jgi:hypothetical protein
LLLFPVTYACYLELLLALNLHLDLGVALGELAMVLELVD